MLMAKKNTGVASRIWLFVQLFFYLEIAICSAKVLGENVCVTEECQEAAMDIAMNMDRDVLPCDNFYQHVCGEFAEDSILTDNQPYISAFDKMEDAISSLIEYYLDNNSFLDKNKPFKKAFKLYELCKNKDLKSGQEVTDLALIVDEIGGWPVVEGVEWKTQKWEVVAGRLSKLGANPKIFFDVVVEAGTFGPNFTILLSPSQFHEFSPTSLERLREIAVEMGADGSADIEKMLNTSSMIASTLRHRSSENDTYGYLTIEEMMMKWPSIDWMVYFTGVFSVWPEINIGNNQRVNANLEYIKDVVDAIGKTNELEIMNYVIAKFIEGYLNVLHYEVSEDLNIVSEQQTINSTSEKRKKNCAAFTSRSLPEMVDAMFLVNHVSDQLRSELIDMFDSIQAKMISTLEQAHWLDINERRNFIERLSNTTFEIGYATALKSNKYFDKYDGLNFDGRSFPRSVLSLARFSRMTYLKKSINPASFGGISPLLMKTFIASPMLTPNARYMSDSNKIVILPGLLQDPYINENLPKYINYGGIGFAIAHELAHVFTDMMESTYQYENGTISNMSEQFLIEIDCFRNQSMSFFMKEFNQTIDRFMAISDDMAANIAVDLAYSVYEDWMMQNQPVSTLARLNYTPPQMFWISHARKNCFKYDSEKLDDMTGRFTYSLEEYRTNIALANNPAFSEAFGCPPKSPMNPMKKCVI